MKNIFQKTCIILMIIFVMFTKSYALDVETHKAINEHMGDIGDTSQFI